MLEYGNLSLQQFQLRGVTHKTTPKEATIGETAQ
jgi:hypothetical protein